MKLLMTVGLLCALPVVGLTINQEWKYSDDMQSHIDSVNHDLQVARLDSDHSTGLIGSLNAMTETVDVATEIFDTHDHVHTLKDRILVWKIKKTIEKSVTVGDAIQSAMANWPESI